MFRGIARATIYRSRADIQSWSARDTWGSIQAPQFAIFFSGHGRARTEIVARGGRSFQYAGDQRSDGDFGNPSYAALRGYLASRRAQYAEFELFARVGQG